MPAVVGPTGLNGLSWRDGDLELARAATSAGLPFVMSTVSMSLIEDVAREAPGRLWLQAYVFYERRITEAIMRRAFEAGFECLMLTSDFPVAGKRERDLRTGLLPQQRFTLRTRLDILMHPRWLATVATRRPRFVNVERELGPGRDVNAFVGHGMFDPSFRWDDVKRFRDLWPRKLLLKGILRADDAERALAAGCDGIVLSNHGGRQLDGAVTGSTRCPRSRARSAVAPPSWWTAACGAAPTSQRPWRSAPRACCSGALPSMDSPPAAARASRTRSGSSPTNSIARSR